MISKWSGQCYLCRLFRPHTISRTPSAHRWRNGCFLVALGCVLARDRYARFWHSRSRQNRRAREWWRFTYPPVRTTIKAGNTTNCAPDSLAASDGATGYLGGHFGPDNPFFLPEIRGTTASWTTQRNFDSRLRVKLLHLGRRYPYGLGSAGPCGLSVAWDVAQVRSDPPALQSGWRRLNRVSALLCAAGSGRPLNVEPPLNRSSPGRPECPGTPPA